jgi:hypothetical protein
MKKFFLFLSLVTAALAQVSIDLRDLAWPASSASQILRRNAANTDWEFVTLSPVITLSGDASGNTTLTNLGNGTLAVTLANSGATAGTYGSVTQIPQVVVDAKGRITSVTALTATPAWSSITGKPTAVDGSTTQTANTVYAGPSSGSAAAPGFRALAQADLQAAASPLRNALAPRGGIAFDGSSGTRISATLTGQAPGTDPFTFCGVFKLPPAIPSQNVALIALTSSATTPWFSSDGSAALLLSNTGRLSLNIRASSGNQAELYVSSFLPAFAGRTVHIAATRSAIYVDGVAMTTSLSITGTGSMSSSVTNTVLSVGYEQTANVLVGTVHSVSIYNLALSAADIQEIYELGGAVPERFKFGNQSATLSSDFEDGLTTGYSSAAATIANSSSQARTGTKSLEVTKTGTGVGGAYRSGTAVFAKNRRYQIVGWIYRPASSAGITEYEFFRPEGGGHTYVTQSGTLANDTWVQFSRDVITSSAASGTLSIYGNTGNIGDKFYIDDVVVKQLGAVVHLDGDADGVGYQWHDQSSNKLDAILTSTGATWTNPRRRGHIRQSPSWSGTHEAKTLDAQLPPGAIIERVVVIPSAATSGSGASFGRNGDLQYYVGLTPLTANAKKVTTLVNTLPYSASHYVIFIDPDTANYTGSITTNIDYTVTEGTP